MKQLYDGEGRPITLTRELGRGGEGAVWEIAESPTLVAKVYHEAMKGGFAVAPMGVLGSRDAPPVHEAPPSDRRRRCRHRHEPELPPCRG